MTLNELTYNLGNIFRGGLTSDDEPVSGRQLAFQIGYYRALFIKRALDERKILNRKYSQDLGCINLISVDKAECCDITWDCTILRTEQPIPSFIQLSFIGLIDKQTQIPFTTYTQSNWNKYSKYTGNIRKAFWRNGYIYIVNDSRLKYVNVQGIFSDPLAAAEFVDCDGKPCFTWDSEYPMPEDMVPQITDLIMSKEGRLLFNSPNDVTNDGPKEPPKAN